MHTCYYSPVCVYPRHFDIFIPERIKTPQCFAINAIPILESYTGEFIRV